MSGWTDGYDTNEAEWATRTMVIARKLIDRVDAEAEMQGYLDIDAIRVVVEAFWQYAEHAEIVGILDNYIEWCESKGTPREMKQLMEMKLRGATNALLGI
jgi:hypothetical protein